VKKPERRTGPITEKEPDEIEEMSSPRTPVIYASWTPLITSLGYSVGFVMVVLSRQQLFTESTVLSYCSRRIHAHFGRQC
jgi:hypothetical protein